MTKLDLGPVGVQVTPGDGDPYLAAVGELEALGYATIWLSGGPMKSLDQIREAVAATRNVRVAGGIISVDRFDRGAVAATYAELEAAHPGRFVVGLGGAHGPRPLRTLGHYLDELDGVPPTVPASARLMAALGPRMLQLAHDRAAGAYSFLVTPEYTARARAQLGDGTTLVVGQFVILEPDPQRARELARRGPLGFLTKAPAYAANLSRMGFAEEEVNQLPDRLVDALIAWGDLDAIAARVQAHLRAGADQVTLSVLSAEEPGSLPLEPHRQLAKALIA